MASEKIKQALGIGKDFRPTSLDSQHRMLSDANEYAVALTAFEKQIRRNMDVNIGFLNDIGKFVTDSPTPRAWQPELYDQPDLPGDSQVMNTPTPAAEHAHLYHPSHQQEIIRTTPGAVADKVHLDMLLPITTWLQAHEAAKERLGHLEKLRLQYDAARRKLQAVEGATPEDSKRHVRLLHLQAKHGPGMATFQSLDAQLHRHLVWLVSQAANLKAYFSQLLNMFKTAAASELMPQGILTPFPTDVLGDMPSQLKLRKDQMAISEPPLGMGAAGTPMVAPLAGEAHTPGATAAGLAPVGLPAAIALNQHNTAGPVGTAAGALHPTGIAPQEGVAHSPLGSGQAPLAAGAAPLSPSGGMMGHAGQPGAAHQPLPGMLAVPATDRLKATLSTHNSSQSLANWGRDPAATGTTAHMTVPGTNGELPGSGHSVGGILPPTSNAVPASGAGIPHTTGPMGTTGAAYHTGPVGVAENKMAAMGLRPVGHDAHGIAHPAGMHPALAAPLGVPSGEINAGSPVQDYPPPPHM